MKLTPVGMYYYLLFCRKKKMEWEEEETSQKIVSEVDISNPRRD